MDEWAQSLAIDRGSEDQVNQLISLLRDTRSCLTELSLSSTNLNVEQINTLFHSLEMSKVVKLTLYYTHFGISNIYPLIQNHLEELSLSGAVNDQVAKVLSFALNDTCQLRKLVLNQNEISIDGINSLVSRIQLLPNLTSLGLGITMCLFDPQSLQALFDVVCEKQMKELEIDVSFDLLYMVSPQNIASLESLTLYKCGENVQLSMEEWLGFVSSLHLSPKLTSFRFSDYPITSQEFQTLCFGVLSQLTSFVVTNARLDEDSGRVVGQILQNDKCQLEHLGLTSCSLLDQGACHIYRSLTFCRLKSLDLRFNQLSQLDELFTSLHSLFCQLTSLKISEDFGVNLQGMADEQLKLVMIKRNAIVLRTAGGVARWGNRPPIAKLPVELCQLVCHFLS